MHGGTLARRWALIAAAGKQMRLARIVASRPWRSERLGEETAVPLYANVCEPGVVLLSAYASCQTGADARLELPTTFSVA